MTLWNLLTGAGSSSKSSSPGAAVEGRPSNASEASVESFTTADRNPRLSEESGGSFSSSIEPFVAMCERTINNDVDNSLEPPPHHGRDDRSSDGGASTRNAGVPSPHTGGISWIAHRNKKAEREEMMQKIKAGKSSEVFTSRNPCRGGRPVPDTSGMTTTAPSQESFGAEEKDEGTNNNEEEMAGIRGGGGGDGVVGGGASDMDPNRESVSNRTTPRLPFEVSPTHNTDGMTDPKQSENKSDTKHPPRSTVPEFSKNHTTINTKTKRPPSSKESSSPNQQPSTKKLRSTISNANTNNPKLPSVRAFTAASVSGNERSNIEQHSTPTAAAVATTETTRSTTNTTNTTGSSRRNTTDDDTKDSNGIASSARSEHDASTEQDGASHADRMEDDLGIVKASTATNTTTTVTVSTMRTSNKNDDGNKILTIGNAVKIVNVNGKRRIIEAETEEEEEEEQEQEQEQEEQAKNEETNVSLDENVSIFKASNATNTTTAFAVPTTSTTNKNDDSNNFPANDNTGGTVDVNNGSKQRRTETHAEEVAEAEAEEEEEEPASSVMIKERKSADTNSGNTSKAKSDTATVSEQTISNDRTCGGSIIASSSENTTTALHELDTATDGEQSPTKDNSRSNKPCVPTPSEASSIAFKSSVADNFVGPQLAAASGNYRDHIPNKLNNNNESTRNSNSTSLMGEKLIEASDDNIDAIQNGEAAKVIRFSTLKSTGKTDTTDDDDDGINNVASSSQTKDDCLAAKKTVSAATKVALVPTPPQPAAFSMNGSGINQVSSAAAVPNGRLSFMHEPSSRSNDEENIISKPRAKNNNEDTKHIGLRDTTNNNNFESSGRRSKIVSSENELPTAADNISTTASSKDSCKPTAKGVNEDTTRTGLRDKNNNNNEGSSKNELLTAVDNTSSKASAKDSTEQNRLSGLDDDNSNTTNSKLAKSNEKSLGEELLTAPASIASTLSSKNTTEGSTYNTINITTDKTYNNYGKSNEELRQLDDAIDNLPTGLDIDQFAFHTTATLPMSGVPDDFKYNPSQGNDIATASSLRNASSTTTSAAHKVSNTAITMTSTTNSMDHLASSATTSIVATNVNNSNKCKSGLLISEGANEDDDKNDDNNREHGRLSDAMIDDDSNRGNAGDNYDQDEGICGFNNDVGGNDDEIREDDVCTAPLGTASTIVDGKADGNNNNTNAVLVTTQTTTNPVDTAVATQTPTTQTAINPDGIVEGNINGMNAPALGDTDPTTALVDPVLVTVSTVATAFAGTEPNPNVPPAVTLVFGNTDRPTAPVGPVLATQSIIATTIAGTEPNPNVSSAATLASGNTNPPTAPVGPVLATQSTVATAMAGTEPNPNVSSAVPQTTIITERLNEDANNNDDTTNPPPSFATDSRDSSTDTVDPLEETNELGTTAQQEHQEGDRHSNNGNSNIGTGRNGDSDNNTVATDSRDSSTDNVNPPEETNELGSTTQHEHQEGGRHSHNGISNIGTGRNGDSDNNTVDDGNTNNGENDDTIIIDSNNGHNATGSNGLEANGDSMDLGSGPRRDDSRRSDAGPPAGAPPVGPLGASNAVPAGDNAIRGSSNDNAGPDAGGGDNNGAGVGAGGLGGVLARGGDGDDSVDDDDAGNGAVGGSPGGGGAGEAEGDFEEETDMSSNDNAGPDAGGGDNNGAGVGAGGLGGDLARGGDGDDSVDDDDTGDGAGGGGHFEEETDMLLTNLQIIVPRTCEFVIKQPMFGDFLFFDKEKLREEDSVQYDLALAFNELRRFRNGGRDANVLRDITGLLREQGINSPRGIIDEILRVINQTYYTDDSDGQVKPLSQSKHFKQMIHFNVVNDLEGRWSKKHVLSVAYRIDSIMYLNTIETNGVKYVVKKIALYSDSNNFIVISKTDTKQDDYHDGSHVRPWINLRAHYIGLRYKVFLVHYEVDTRGDGGYRPQRNATMRHLFGLPDTNADLLRTCWADGIIRFFRRIGLLDEHGNEFQDETLRKMELLQAKGNKCNVNVYDVQQWFLYESPIRFQLCPKPALTSSRKGQLFAKTENMYFFITSFCLNGAAFTPLTNLHVALFCGNDRLVTDAFGTMKLDGEDGKDDKKMQQMMKDMWGEQHEYNIESVYEIKISKTRSAAQGEKLREMLRVSKFMECYPFAH